MLGSNWVPSNAGGAWLETGLEEGVEAAVLWEEKGMDWGKFVMVRL